MARFLQQLLGAQEPIFSRGLVMLEKSTGNSSIDVRLIADITENAHKIMRKLNMDTSDTTGRELYAALLATVEKRICEDILIDTDYTMIMLDNQIISLNLIDVIENAHHKMPYSHQIFSHGQRSLRGELVSRYVDHARTNDETTRNIATSIGLILKDDAYYDKLKHKHKTLNKPKELIK